MLLPTISMPSSLPQSLIINYPTHFSPTSINITQFRNKKTQRNPFRKQKNSLEIQKADLEKPQKISLVTTNSCQGYGETHKTPTVLFWSENRHVGKGMVRGWPKSLFCQPTFCLSYLARSLGALLSVSYLTYPMQDVIPPNIQNNIIQSNHWRHFLFIWCIPNDLIPCLHQTPNLPIKNTLGSSHKNNLNVSQVLTDKEPKRKLLYVVPPIILESNISLPAAVMLNWSKSHINQIPKQPTSYNNFPNDREGRFNTKINKKNRNYLTKKYGQNQWRHFSSQHTPIFNQPSLYHISKTEIYIILDWWVCSRISPGLNSCHEDRLTQNT